MKRFRGLKPVHTFCSHTHTLCWKKDGRNRRVTEKGSEEGRGPNNGISSSPLNTSLSRSQWLTDARHFTPPFFSVARLPGSRFDPCPYWHFSRNTFSSLLFSLLIYLRQQLPVPLFLPEYFNAKMNMHNPCKTANWCFLSFKMMLGFFSLIISRNIEIDQTNGTFELIVLLILKFWRA